MPVHCEGLPVSGKRRARRHRGTPLKPDTGQLILSAVRRSLWLVVLLVIVGAVSINVLRQRQGPLHEASATVVLSPTDLAASVAGSSYIDPQRIDATEEALATSPELYAEAARRTEGTYGTGPELQDATTAQHSGTSITFSASSSDSRRAIGIANAVAVAYPEWRAAVSGAAIDRAMEQVQKQLTTSNDPALRDQMARLRLLKTLTSGNVLLVEQADSATKVRPKPLRDSIIGVLLGLLVAMITIGIREAVDTRVRSETEVEEILDAPVVGSVERLPSKSRLVVLGRHGVRFSDVYGLLAATVARSAGDGVGRVVVVTSATPQEGKTTTAANLAAALAKRNSDVVLVDLDTRKPALAEVFGVSPTSPGTAEVLGHKIAATEAMHEISLAGRPARAARRSLSEDDMGSSVLTRANGGGSLRLLPAGRWGQDGVVPYRADLEALTDELRQEADFVIVDTPPALSTPDTSEIVRQADVLLVVVRQGRVSRRVLAELSRLIRTWPPVHVNAVLVDTVMRDDYAYYAR